MAESDDSTVDAAAERWLPVVGWGAGWYEVSDLGQVRRSRGGTSTYAGRLLRSVPVGGYLYVTLSVHNRTRSRSVHTLVMRTFRGAPPPGMEVRHLNGRRDDPRLSNLEWSTKAENEMDKLRHGTLIRGSKHYGAKLTETDALRIRELAASGASNRDIARVFGVHRITVFDVVHRRTWKHV